MAWSGSICLSGNDQVKDISLDDAFHSISNTAKLRFLSLVEVQRIPLYLMLSAPLKVSTSNGETERWFRDILLSTPTKHFQAKWWESARPDSPVGILVALEDPRVPFDSSHPRITELLFHASPGAGHQSLALSAAAQSTRGEEVTSAPEFDVYATAISSDLLHRGKDGELTPPTSPLVDIHDAGATFLPYHHSVNAEVINEPPTRKRRSATDAFDEANERRKRARRKGGEGVSAAAASSKTESNVVSLKHERSTSNSQSVPLQTRPLSRSPSVASSRPATAVTSVAQRSALSRVETATKFQNEQSQSVEGKNKDTISRIVMAGMRLHGLSQSNSRKNRTSAAASIDGDDEVDRKNDEEYKLVYHQTFKGTCFAFRATIGAQSLQPLSDAVRDVADRLLSIFCGNPLLGDRSSNTALDTLTPGGRKAFGSSASKEAT